MKTRLPQVVLLMLCCLVFGAARAEAAVRPTFVIAFVPLHWSADEAAFAAAVETQTTLFLAESNIEAYADIQIVLLDEEFDGARLSDPNLVARLVRFAAQRQPADRYVGLTDGDLAPFGDRSVVGWTHGPGAVGMVAEIGDPAVTAHELGHTFALCDEYAYREWSRQNNSWGCPNPYPPECLQSVSPIGLCPGLPATDGRHSIMGPAGRSGDYAFNSPSYAHLQQQFAALFGGDGSPPAFPPPALPTTLGATVVVAKPALTLVTPTGETTRLTDAPAWTPAWALDGQRLAYATLNMGTLDLYVLDIGDGESAPIVQGPGQQSHPVWLPDGQHVLFGNRSDGTMAIWRVRLADGAAEPVPEMPPDCFWPTLTPTGDRLALACLVQGRWEVFVLPFDPVSVQPVGRPERVGSSGNQAVAPAWSPDGTRLAWIGGATDGTGRSHLVVFEMATGRASIVRGPDRPWAPAWLSSEQLLLHAGTIVAPKLFRVSLIDSATQPSPAAWQGAAWPAVRPEVDR